MGHKFVHIWHRVNEEARCSENKSTRLTLFASILKHCEVHWFGIKYKRQANRENKHELVFQCDRVFFPPFFLFLKAITMCILSVPFFLFFRWKWKSLEVEIKLAWNVNLCEYHEPGSWSLSPTALWQASLLTARAGLHT